jgi:hypothetical protein
MGYEQSTFGKAFRRKRYAGSRFQHGLHPTFPGVNPTLIRLPSDLDPTLARPESDLDPTLFRANPS